MAETNALPSDAQILAYRSDLATYLPGGGTLQGEAATALEEVKRYLEDKRGILWRTVYDLTNDLYFVDPEGVERNQDRIQKAIILFTVAGLFKDYSVLHGGSWWELYLAHRSDAEETLKDARLDVDLDESGAIDDGETAILSQVFMTR